MSKGTNIAAKVKAALAKGAAATGDGPLVGTLIRRGTASGPVYEPTYGSDLEYTCNVLFSEFDTMEKAGTSVAANDVKLLVSVLDVEPTVADKIKVAGITYEIVNADPTRPGGEVLMWEIQARR